MTAAVGERGPEAPYFAITSSSISSTRVQQLYMTKIAISLPLSLPLAFQDRLGKTGTELSGFGTRLSHDEVASGGQHVG